MHFSLLLTTFLATLTFTAALPLGIPYSEDLKAIIAQHRAQERHLASLISLSDEKRAYQRETIEIATFKYNPNLDAAVLKSGGMPSKQT